MGAVANGGKRWAVFALIVIAVPVQAASNTSTVATADPLAVVRQELALGCDAERARTKDFGTLEDLKRELDARYAENGAGFIARDVDRVMRLRHPDFHTEQGTTRMTREQMHERTRRFIEGIVRFDCIVETITALTLEGATAHAIVDQRTVRQQRFADGTTHDVRTWVVQRESWRRVANEWLLWRVDEINDGLLLVDGQVYKNQ
jgi:hypothetical protein